MGDAIRPFMLIPSDASTETRNRLIEENVEKCWQQLGRRGFHPTPLSAGPHWDKVEERWKHATGNLDVMVMGPVIFPVGHQNYGEGMDTYLLVNQDHSHIQWSSPNDRLALPFHMDDKTAAEMQMKGLLKVHEWDTPMGAERLQRLLDRPAPTLEEQQEAEYKAEQRKGLTPTKMEVPYITPV